MFVVIKRALHREAAGHTGSVCSETPLDFTVQTQCLPPICDWGRLGLLTTHL